MLREVFPGQVIPAGTPYRVKRLDGTGAKRVAKDDVIIFNFFVDRYFVEEDE